MPETAAFRATTLKITWPLESHPTWSVYSPCGHQTWPFENPLRNMEALISSSKNMIQLISIWTPLELEMEVFISYSVFVRNMVQLFMDPTWIFQRWQRGGHCRPKWRLQKADLVLLAVEANMETMETLQYSNVAMDNSLPGWWLGHPFWKKLVNWDDYSQYMGK